MVLNVTYEKKSPKTLFAEIESVKVRKLHNIALLSTQKIDLGYLVVFLEERSLLNGRRVELILC
jgi:hypothetical protein